MLHRLHAKGFKSLRDVDVELARLVVVFGANAAGKSNLLEALVLYSRLVRERTLAEAFNTGIRGYPSEAFSFGPPDRADDRRALSLHGEIDDEHGSRLAYGVDVSIRPATGELSLEDELLARLTSTGKRKGNATMERVDTDVGPRLRIRRKNKQSHPFEENVGIGHTVASNLQFSGGDRFPDFDALRAEVDAWRVVYLDPREAMRRSQPPREVDDIGERGEYLVPFLHRLRVNESWHPRFKAIERALRSVVPSVRAIHTELVPSRGEIDLFIEQDDVRVPVRVLSEGTLRVLALSAMAASPFPTRLLAFEEPENGVHPQRVETITRLLASAARKRQVVVTTHSPLVVGGIISMLRSGELDPSDVRLIQCTGTPDGTRAQAFDPAGELFTDQAVRQALVAADDAAAVVQGAFVRGWIDG